MFVGGNTMREHLSEYVELGRRRAQWKVAVLEQANDRSPTAEPDTKKLKLNSAKLMTHFVKPMAALKNAAFTVAGIDLPNRWDDPTIELGIVGQGTVSVEYPSLSSTIDQFDIDLTNSKDKLVTITVKDNQLTITVPPNSYGQRTPLTASVAINDPAVRKPFWPTHLLHFKASSQWLWVSVDRANHRVRVGFGYQMQVNTLLELALPEEVQDLPVPADELVKPKTLHNVSIVDFTTATKKGLKFASPPKNSNRPIVQDPPFVVVGTDEMTLEQIATNSAIPVGSLPAEAQQLWASVAGNNVILSPSDADAINYSLDNPGFHLHEILKSKMGEFGDPAMVYIRCTIGPDQGNSPGICFVLEIWPKKKMSPIHAHSNAVAVIKVLHGELDVHFFNPPSNDPDTDADPNNRAPIAQTDPNNPMKAGQRTFLLPDLYATHRLYNPSMASMTATIQSYKYLEEDTAHFEFFSWLDPKSRVVKQFKPNSDIDYLDLLRIVRQEVKTQTPVKYEPCKSMLN